MITKRYRINQINLNLGESVDLLHDKIAEKIGNKEIEISDIEIVKQSIDARKKEQIKQVFSVDFSSNAELNLPRPKDVSYIPVEPGTINMKHRPIVIGFGPCGMFAGLILAEAGYNPIILERGYDIDRRVKVVNEFWKKGILDKECNVQFGEGGAGTFSDGKLTSGIKDPRKYKVFDEFIKAGADPDIRYMHLPHVGTDVLRHVVKNIREKITDLGGEIRFDSRVNRIIEKDGHVKSVIVQQDHQLTLIDADTIILAMGHSSRDTLRRLVKNGISMEQKPFSIGVRIEHPQQIINNAQYGKGKGVEGLPPATYKLAHKCENGRGVYTFCMCPGGKVIIASSEEDRVVTNGMSYRSRNSGFANSGLLVDVRVEDFEDKGVLSGVEFQEKYESLAFKNGGGRYNPPTSTWKAFRDGDKEAEGVINSLPEFAVESIKEAMPNLGRKLKGFDMDDAKLIGVETRSSSPVRIIRDSNFESSLKGLFPGGEGAGYAGGITSSAVDGIKIAEEIIKRYAPLK